MEVSFRSNFKDLEKSLSDTANKQLPFAMARSLTELARNVRDAEKDALHTVFDRPTPFTQNSVGYKAANKQSLEAQVFVKDIASKYLEPYEFGGDNMLNSEALIKPVNYSKNQYGNVNRNTIKRLRTKSNIYIGKIGGINGVWERAPVPRNANRKSRAKQASQKPKLKLLFIFDDAHEAIQHWGYFNRANKIIHGDFNKTFGKNLAKAIAMAK